MTEDVSIALVGGSFTLLTVLVCGLIVVWMNADRSPTQAAPRPPNAFKDRFNAMVAGRLP